MKIHANSRHSTRIKKATSLCDKKDLTLLGPGVGRLYLALRNALQYFPDEATKVSNTASEGR